MLTQTSTTERARFDPWQPGIWRWQFPHGRRVRAGTTDRTGDWSALQRAFPRVGAPVVAEQIHGASLAAVESPNAIRPLPGCDGLLTQQPNLLLVVRTADCLPLFLWDPVQRVVGVVHAGWCGLARQVPMKLIAFAQQTYRSRPQDVWVGIGPAIHACCYEVGQEFGASFASYLDSRGGRLHCDLIRCATDQLMAAGVAPSRILDAGCCTACEAGRWYSLRKEGGLEQRLLSFITLS